MEMTVFDHNRDVVIWTESGLADLLQELFHILRGALSPRPHPPGCLALPPGLGSIPNKWLPSPCPFPSTALTGLGFKGTGCLIPGESWGGQSHTGVTELLGAD